MPEGERFAIIQTDSMIAQTFPPPRGERWYEAVQRYWRSQQLLTEVELRARLLEMGLDEPAASQQIQKARKVLEMNLNAMTSWDHVTTIGYRNREGQEVLRKTDRVGSTPDQRVFVLRCSVCGYEYGSNGSDIYNRLCPNCQEGPAGL
jgi:hypothetical protein